jgi:hypothetical protein
MQISWLHLPLVRKDQHEFWCLVCPEWAMEEKADSFSVLFCIVDSVDMFVCAVEHVNRHLAKNKIMSILGMIFELHCVLQKCCRVFHIMLPFCISLATTELFLDSCDLQDGSKLIYFCQRKCLVRALTKLGSFVL